MRTKFALLVGSVAITTMLIAARNVNAAQTGSDSRGTSAVHDPACEKAGPKGCAALALDAMGGKARLEAIKSVSFESIGHTLLVEQSYRQDPFITSYESVKGKVDFAGNRVRLETHMTWPESDPGQAESDLTLVAGPEGGVYKLPPPVSSSATDAAAKPTDAPCSLSALDGARDTIALDPIRLLLSAEQAGDLHFESAKTVRSTRHLALAFDLHGTQTRILINPFNHLPDAVETVTQFHDHWYQWGDVNRRIYFENWQDFHGVIYPTNQVEERNGILWHSSQILKLEWNPAVEDALFAMDSATAQRSAQGKGWDRAFQAKEKTELAPGVTLYPGAWNATIVKQDDGIVLLEAPISGTYFSGVVEQTKQQYPGQSIKAVLSTSDSWPHVGGVRQAVALKLPVYILDLNQPLLDRMTTSPRSLHPDLLAQSPQKPVWRVVSQKTTIGTGANRMELYPLRGASTERQYMAYFPEHQLLYASDTLALNDDGSLYDPELMREVVEAVKRERLQVKTVFAMHQGPVAWEQVKALVEKANG